MAPVLLIVLTVAGWAFGAEATQVEIERQVRMLLGPDSAELVREVLDSANRPELRGISGIAAVVALIFGATAIFGQLQAALNAVWGVKPRDGHMVRDFLRKRLLSFGLVLALGFLLLVSLLLSTALSAFGSYFQARLNLPAGIMSGANFVVFLLLTSLLFALIYRVLPDARIAWRDVAVGSVATAVLFSLGKWLIGLYLGRAGVSSAYGAAGSLVLLLLWVYYGSMILLLGAGFTRVWSRRNRPAGVAPEPGARREPDVEPDIEPEHKAGSP